MFFHNVYFLDVFIFVFLFQFVLSFYKSSVKIFLFFLSFNVFSAFGSNKNLFLSSVFSSILFYCLLFMCFTGYFSYSFSPCGMIEFTLIFSLIFWGATFLCFLSSEKLSIYFSKSGDMYLKTMSMLLVEIVSEFSRPVALTVRLTVNLMVGHMICSSLFLLSINFFFSSVLFSFLAIMLECFVFFIQSYIFTRLIFLYLNE